MAGWLDVKRRYCIKTAKPILNLLQPDSAVILVSNDPCADTKFQGEPLQRGALNTQVLGKIGDFRPESLFTLETVRDRPVLLWNVNRNSWVPDRLV